MGEFKTTPVIGISGMNTDSKSVAAMVSQVRALGAIPMVFANHANRDAAADIEKIDALMVMGNDFDVDPNRYIGGYPEGDPRRTIHPKTNSAAHSSEATARAVYEEKLLTLAMEKKLPTLGVCAAMQSLNVMRGGGLLQHIPDLIGDEHHEQNKENLPGFCPVVPVTIEAGSALSIIADGANTLYTPSFPPPSAPIGITENSFHHQAVDPDRVGYGLRITAWSDAYKNVHGEMRRLPEAIEPDPNGPLAGWKMRAVQWHPEFGASRVSGDLIGTTIAEGIEYAATHPRDRSRDSMNAMANNIASSKKTSAGFVGDLAARGSAVSAYRA